jgi:hypothetical protein
MMKKLCTLLASLVLCLLAVPNAAQAQATRTWVSGVGDDANPCSRTAPCKTFAGAISKTATAGEINCLDPGGFGALTITKAISIICQAGTAGVLVSGTNGIVVAAGATDKVYLHGLDFEGLAPNSGPGLSGVLIDSAGIVTIEDCIIKGFSVAGINLDNSSSGVALNVIGTTIADNTGEGILIKPSGTGTTRVMIDHATVSDNAGDGIYMNGNLTSGGLKMTIRNTEAVHNADNGIAVSSNGAVSLVMVDSSNVLNNTTGLAANGPNATLYFTRTIVNANGTGVNQAGSGVVTSYGTNSIAGNGVNGTFGTTSQQ